MPKRVLIPFRSAQKAIPYAEAARSGGVEPVALSVENKLSLAGFDGLLLTGGTDVNPKRFGADAHPKTEEPDEERDRVELELIGQAMERDLPILGICRGLQILNVFHGGTLIQHLDSAGRHDPKVNNPADAAHKVAFVRGTQLAGLARDGEWNVNSRHHQAIGRLGEQLRAAAHDAEDATVIEGIERPGKRFVVAVQWHPEDQIRQHPEHLRLFRSFAAAL